jgi:hypothetical protein
MRRVQIVLTILLLAVAGCAAKEQLITKSAVVPAGIDLSGRWELRDDGTDTARRIEAAERRAAGGLEDIVQSSRRSSRSRPTQHKAGSLVHVFLETGQSLKITQTEHGLFISFDRAIVEEYLFGEHRVANVGPIMAERVSGWENRDYVIETQDEEGGKLLETYSLAENNAVLIRDITVLHNQKQKLAIQQVFDRVIE